MRDSSGTPTADTVHERGQGRWNGSGWRRAGSDALLEFCVCPPRRPTLKHRFRLRHRLFVGHIQPLAIAQLLARVVPHVHRKEPSCVRCGLLPSVLHDAFSSGGCF
eukprot:scaffold119619_cov61-Phaeocystis_antarctica.AAC.2